MTARDRVSESYKGEISTRAHGRVTERIGWICQQVEGQKVIDVGCSQGITSIVLARKGFRVVGVDVDAFAIDYANADRAKEIAEVQERLTFVRSSIYDLDLPPGGFDTAIMGEFLEHQARPDEAVAKAWELLVDNGKLVVTVPFGFLEHPDHKQTFYIAWLCRLIHPCFATCEVAISGRYLYVACRKRQPVLEEEAHSVDLALVDKAEQAFLEREIERKRQTERYKAELTALKRSFAFRVGNMVLEAVRRPGRHTILLPYRALRFAVDAYRKTSRPVMHHAVAQKAQVLQVVKEWIDAVRQEALYAGGQTLEPRRPDLRIAVIMDPFTYECFQHEAHLITFTPKEWRRVLARKRPNLLLVESAWRGINSTWRHKMVRLGEGQHSELPEIARWCRARQIPTAFWAKEDPGHYEDFLDAARLFDYVFTTDADCIEKYKEDLGHTNIFCLPFAAQPRLHNPIGSGRKIRDVAFAGTWYPDETATKMQRREQMACVLAPALAYDVDIYERGFSSKESRRRFPEQYRSHIVGELPYEEMVYAYRLYRVFLNVSSVRDSPTQFPRRVVEILASGTCVLSGSTRGIESLLGSDIVLMSSSPEETTRYLDTLLKHPDLRDRLAVLGLRKVMQEHTYQNRLDYVLDTMGISRRNCGCGGKGISVITRVTTLSCAEPVFSNYDRQQRVEKELIIMLNSDSTDFEAWLEQAAKHHNVTVCRMDEMQDLGACLKVAAEKSRFDYIARFDSDAYYAPSFLEDLMLAFGYSGADIVGKATRYAYFDSSGVLAIEHPGREHQFARDLPGSAMILKRELLEKMGGDSAGSWCDDAQLLQRYRELGLRMYSADRFNFVRIIRQPHETDLTEAGARHVLGDDAQIVRCATDYVTHVTC